MPSFNLNRILLLFVGFIVYGSLFPFDFTWTPREASVLEALSHIDSHTPRWGDIISNVILFIPYGFLGMAVATGQRSIWPRASVFLLAGAGLAFGLQGAQVYLPTRVPSLVDALCNVLGIFLGALLCLPLRALTWPSLPTFSRIDHIALGLMAVWVLDNLWPMIPAFDFQTLRDGLKPLIMQPPISLFKIAMTAISWMLIYHLWEFVLKNPPRMIWQIESVATMFGLEILMESNALQWEEVFGAILALMVWNLGINQVRQRKEILVVLLISILVWNGLSPFTWRDVPVSFYWMPFGISIMGEPLNQISVIIEKCFLYGCLAWLLIERRTHLSWALVLSVGTLMCLEFAQRYVVEHTPEITDPLLVFFLVLLIKNVFQRQHDTQNLASRPRADTLLTPHSIPR